MSKYNYQFERGFRDMVDNVCHLEEEGLFEILETAKTHQNMDYYRGVISAYESHVAIMGSAENV